MQASSSSEQPVAPSSRLRSEIVARTLVGLPALAIVIVLVWLGGIPFVVALALLGGACLYELDRLYADARVALPAAIVALVGLLAAAQWGGYEQVLLATMAAVPLTFIVTLFFTRSGTFGVSLTLLGIIWIALALAHAVLLRRLPHGEDIVFDVLAGTFVGDSAAYLGGRVLGRHTLAPTISPNKTLEGLMIGIAAAVASVWVASRFEPWLHGGDALLLGAGIAIAAPLGDLFESYIKRDAGAKDTGRLFGAHGGALDRLDAVLFTAVTSFYVWHAILLAR
jgi:phosphatidate cytidylyltransferase